MTKDQTQLSLPSVGGFPDKSDKERQNEETLTQAVTARVDLEILSRNEEKQGHTSSNRDCPWDPRVQMLS